MDWKTAGATEIPKTTGNYMKFEQGANKFRILSEPVMGWEYWTEEKGKEKSKPVRALERWTTIPVNADLKNGWNPKYFWAFTVWHFDLKKLMILEITQSTILKPLQDLVANEDWGDPRQYSITINKKGEKLDTEYNLVPSPAKPTPPEILEMYKNAYIRLESLFDGTDPFDESTKPEFVPKDETNTAFDDEDFDKMSVDVPFD